MRIFLVVFSLQTLLAVSAFGNDVCTKLFSSPGARERLEADLSNNLHLVPQKIAEKLVTRLAKKIDSHQISQSDLLNATHKFYRALDKPWFNTSALEHREAFYEKLKAHLISENIVLKTGVWQKFKEWTYTNSSVISATHFLAIHAALMSGFYALTGDLNWLVLYLPTLTSKSVVPKKSYQVAAYYYDRISTALLKVYYASALAFIALHPQVAVDSFSNLYQTFQIFNSAGVELALEQQQQIRETLVNGVGFDNLENNTAVLEEKVKKLLEPIK